MEERGYAVIGVGRKRSDGPIEQKQYRKTVHCGYEGNNTGGNAIHVRVDANVFSGPDECDTCWKAQLKYYGLKYFMAIDSHQFNLTRKDNDWDRIENGIVQFALACNQVNHTLP